MTDDFEEFDKVPERPTFLKVLCILTFIGSGYVLLNSALTYFNADKISQMVVEAKNTVNEDLKKNKNPEKIGLMTKIMSNMITSPDDLRKKAAGDVVGALFCLSGAILMWKLKRIGFYLYVAGTLLGIAIPFYLFGNNITTVIAVGFASFIGILFIIFYAMNIKSMKY